MAPEAGLKLKEAGSPAPAQRGGAMLTEVEGELNLIRAWKLILFQVLCKRGYGNGITKDNRDE